MAQRAKPELNIARRWLNRVGGALLLAIALAIVAVVAWRFLLAPMYPASAGIAHAGGRIGGQSYTNSIAAFDNAYANGFRLIEVDFQYTSDGVLVCGHDWNDYPGGPPSLAGLIEDLKAEDYPACQMDELFAWLAAHEDVRLVSDAKDAPLAINQVLHTELGPRLIAQAYSVEDVGAYRAAGIEDIVLTLYRVGGYAAMVDEIERLQTSGAKLWALTMPGAEAIGGLALWAKFRTGLPVYAHTINSCQIGAVLQALAVDAFYTDDLPPEGC